MNPENPYGTQDPGGSPYPRFSGRMPRREIDLASIGEAWGIITKNWAPFALGGLLTVVVIGIIYAAAFAVFMGGTIAAAAAGETPVDPGFVPQLLMGFFTVVGVFIGTAFFMAGFNIMALKALRGETPTIGDLFGGFSRNPGGILAAALLIGLMVGIGSNLCYLPGIILGGLSMLSLPLIVDRGLGPIEAIKESFSLMSKNIVMASVIYFLASLASGLGFLLCCIGLLVTMPLLYVTQAVIYEDLTADSAPGPQF
jgi:uncharacterized membrane protein